MAGAACKQYCRVRCWEANMDLIGDEPVINMADRDFRIFSRNEARPPQYIGLKATIENSLISEGCKINGTVINSVLSGGVVIEEGALVKDSVIMEDVVIKSGAKVYSAIVDSDTVVEFGATVGTENADKSDIAIVAKGTTVYAK